MKHIITTAENAVKKGLVKVGGKILIDCSVIDIKNNVITVHSHGKNITLPENRKIRIPKPEPKPIDFGVAGRVLEYKDGYIFITTGKSDEFQFFGYNPHSGWAGIITIENQDNWTDITDTYKP